MQTAGKSEALTDNPFEIDGIPIPQFQEEAVRWKTDKEGWLYEWRLLRRAQARLDCETCIFKMVALAGV